MNKFCAKAAGAVFALLLVPPLTSGSANAQESSESVWQNNRVRYSVDVARSVDHDKLVARLTVSEEAAIAAKASERVNETMEWAKKQIQKVADIKFQTESYHSSPIYDDRRISGWRVTQSLQLSSTKNIDKLTELVGKLQEKLQVTQLGFELSDEKREQVKSELIEEGLKQFMNRGNAIVEALNKSSFDVHYIDLESNFFAPPQPMRARAMNESMAFSKSQAPVVESEGEKVTLTVRGEIIFK